jgi:hypothetical protein
MYEYIQSEENFGIFFTEIFFIFLQRLVWRRLVKIYVRAENFSISTIFRQYLWILFFFSMS